MRKLLFSLVALLVLGSVINNSSAAVLPSATNNANPDPATVKAAIENFKSLPRKREKKSQTCKRNKGIQCCEESRQRS